MNTEIELLEPVAKPDPTTTALAIVNTQVAKFCAIEDGLQELEKRYKDVVYAVDTTSGLEEAKKARQEIRQVRFNAQNLLKETTKPLNQIKADVTKFAERIIERIVLSEEPIDAQIKAQETRKEAEKLAKEEEARQLAAKVDASLAALRLDPLLVGATAFDIEKAIVAIDAVEVSIEVFGARAGEALQLKMETLDKLEVMQDRAAEQESAQAQLAAQQQALVAAQKKLAEQQAQLETDQRIARMAEAARVEAARRLEAERVEEARLVEERTQAEAARVRSEAAAAEQRRLDDIATAERKRLDEEAAARRAADLAEAQRLADIERIAHEADEKLRDAAKDLLDAAVEFSEAMHKTNGTPSSGDDHILLQHAVNHARAAITLAIGEQS